MSEMSYEERRKIYERAIEHFGVEAQKRILIEEIGELLDALMKYERGRDTLAHVAEEIGDVTVALEEARLFLGINEVVKDEMRAKCERLVERIERA